MRRAVAGSAVATLLAMVLGCGRVRAQPEPAPVPSPAPAPAPAPRPTGPTNVLIVVLDDVGVEHVAAYGTEHGAPATPTLSKLAAEGVRFTHAWSNPVCSPTRSTILTGRYARRTGIGQIIDSWKTEHDLADDEITLPEMLARSGAKWDSAAIGKWHLASARSGPMAPGRQGFRTFAGTLGNLRDKYGGGKEDDWGYDAFMKNDNGKLREVHRYVTTDTADDAIERIGAMREPWLLYLAFNAAHYPMHVPPKGLAQAPGLGPQSPDPDKYDAVLMALDHELGRVLAAMSTELRARTTVIVIGDNGTPDFAIRPPFDPERAKGSVFELGVHVPLLVTGPYVAEPGTTSDALVNGVDLFATVADIARVDTGALGRPIDGVSLLPALADPAADTARKYQYTEKFLPNGPGPYDRLTVAVRDQEYKLVVDRKRDGSVERRLYAIGDDLDEGRNLLAGGRDPAGAAADALARLEAELKRIESSFER